jgi:hypothetical protein
LSVAAVGDHAPRRRGRIWINCHDEPGFFRPRPWRA